MLFIGYFAKITLWWILRERKKNVEGAAKVALTGDRFLTCLPSHLLWVKAWRHSRTRGREKRGAILEKMARAAGRKGNTILTGNGKKLFTCTANLFVLRYCGNVVYVYARQAICTLPIEKNIIRWSYSYYNKNIEMGLNTGFYNRNKYAVVQS